jgi:hypothetical protein
MTQLWMKINKKTKDDLREMNCIGVFHKYQIGSALDAKKEKMLTIHKNSAFFWGDAGVHVPLNIL